MTVQPIDFGKFDPAFVVEQELFAEAKSAGFDTFQLFRDSEVDFSLGRFGSSSSASFAATSPSHVFIHVREGGLTLRSGGQELALETGQVAIIRQQSSIEWAQGANTWVDFCSFVDADAAGGGPLMALSSDVALDPSAPSPKDMLLSDVPTQSGKALFSDSSGRFKAGVWESTPYHRKTIPFPRHEFMCLLEGEVTLTPPDGEGFTFRKGDVFLIPRGWVADWNATSFLKKFYCTFT